VAETLSQKSLSVMIKNQKKKNMEIKIKLAIMAGALGLAVQANASLYNVTFTGTDGVTATGTLNVVSGVATGGSLDVTGGGNASNYTLLAESASPGEYIFDASNPVITQVRYAA